MPRNSSKYYWWCQAGGWAFLALVIMVLSATSFEQRFTSKVFLNTLVVAFSGMISTHLFRAAIKYFNWLPMPVQKALPKFAIGILLTCIIGSLARIFLGDMLQQALPSSFLKSGDFMGRLLAMTAEYGIMVIPWTLIYYVYHMVKYVEDGRKQQVETLKLEALVKELELKTIKAHINPHFIFNALNSIRALIDENPIRARTAVTELSNILRSSMQAEKMETVTFEKELNIVKDYLALEHIRFEDRLQVEYEIDEDTLDQPVPPMMLQTLVENAIKHGISRQVDGGKVRIVSDFKADFHELVILNTGRLNGNRDMDGFGLASTKNRLQILFGQKANFDIREVNGNTVQARVLIPVDLRK